MTTLEQLIRRPPVDLPILPAGPETVDSQAIQVLPARHTDRDYVIDAFETALSPYYGGDHAAHAKRVIDTHLRGGSDDRGLLSVRQLLLILWQHGERRGLVNLVFKRQATCKISPLLLHPVDTHGSGLGDALMGIVMDKALNAGARQLYCTVTERNRNALGFFLRHGFTTCGRSDGQYKNEETEVLLRHRLRPADAPGGDESIISVTEVTDPAAWNELRPLLEAAHAHIDGADDTWLRAFLAGLRVPANARGDGGDGVYCARDRTGRYRAAAVAVRKKGDAIKVMPVAALDDEAFAALVTDLPSLLQAKGRKVYLHLLPTAGQVTALQEYGWALEALLPHAYGAGQVTQQWGHGLGDDVPVKLRIRPEYLRLIRSGRKTLEIRVGYDNILRIKAGTELELISHDDRARCVVRAVRRYDSFADMIRHEPMERALPGTDTADALPLLRAIYPPSKEELGVVVLEIDAGTADRDNFGSEEHGGPGPGHGHGPPQRKRRTTQR